MKSEDSTYVDWGKVKFFLGEVFANFSRNAGMQLTAIGTVCVTIVLLGAFLYTRETVASLGNGILNKIEIAVYLDDSVSDSDAKKLGDRFASDPRVSSAQYVPKKEGLRRMHDVLGRDFDLSLLTANPFPNAYHVRVKNPDLVPQVAAHIAKIHGVAKADYAADTVTKLLKVSDTLGRVGLVMIGLLVFTAAIIIANTIRLTVFARRREIAIMQLVGATNGYIRGPFIMEGMVAGLAGALAAIGVLAIARWQVLPKLTAALAFVPFHANEPLIAGELLAVGAAVGFIAAWISVGRYLRT